MKTITYLAFTAWISIAVSVLGTMYVMSKIRTEDATRFAARNIETLLHVNHLIDEAKLMEARAKLRVFLEAQPHIAQRCDYNVCVSPIPEDVTTAIQHAKLYLDDH